MGGNTDALSETDGKIRKKYRLPAAVAESCVDTEAAGILIAGNRPADAALSGCQNDSGGTKK